jgi:hypothetical protein
MKVKVYRVWPKNDPELWYLVDAPSKRIARWCGSAIMNNDYATFLTAKDMVAERFKAEDDRDE